jgi:uncharacterized damage-inducible protein DinB
MMIKQALLGEFTYEAENTRKLLLAIPDTALEYRPQPHLWSIAQLASHITSIYAWYEGVFGVDVFDFGTFHYEREDGSKVSNIVAKFEENVAKAKKAIEESDESTYFNDWTMKSGEQVFIGPMPKVQAGNLITAGTQEMVAHLRASGNKVPGLYGPTYEQSQKK